MRTALLLIPFLLAAPAALAAEPGGFWPVVPWIVQGSVLVSAEGGDPTPCVEQTTGTIYAWVESWQANFQLTLAGGCGEAITIFHGEGDIWNGWVLSDFMPSHPTSGWLDGFETGEPIELDMTQTMPTGETMRVTGVMTIIF